MKVSMIAGAGLIALALVSLLVAFLLFAAAAVTTVVSSTLRAKRRHGGLGPLTQMFPERVLEELDEALERTWLEESQRR